MKNIIQKSHFLLVCGDNTNNVSNMKLTKNRFKQFLSLKYGSQISDKL